MKQVLLTVSQAAKLKGVSRSAVYKAISQKRLPHRYVLGHLAVREADVLAWDENKEKPGRARGQSITPEHRARIAEAQKKRWQLRKHGDIQEN